MSVKVKTPLTLQRNLAFTRHTLLLGPFFSYRRDNRTSALGRSPGCCQGPWPLVLRRVPSLLAFSGTPGPPPCRERPVLGASDIPSFGSLTRRGSRAFRRGGFGFFLRSPSPPHTAASPALRFGLEFRRSGSLHTPGQSARVPGTILSTRARPGLRPAHLWEGLSHPSRTTPCS